MTGIAIGGPPHPGCTRRVTTTMFRPNAYTTRRTVDRTVSRKIPGAVDLAPGLVEHRIITFPLGGVSHFRSSLIFVSVWYETYVYLQKLDCLQIRTIYGKK